MWIVDQIGVARKSFCESSEVQYQNTPENTANSFNAKSDEKATSKSDQPKKKTMRKPIYQEDWYVTVCRSTPMIIPTADT